MEENKKSGARHSHPSPPENKAASPKNCAYRLKDSIVFIDSCSWGM
ncbi:MAG: hypothetical protein ACI307_10810 [Sodaliphilus sp.]